VNPIARFAGEDGYATFAFTVFVDRQRREFEEPNIALLDGALVHDIARAGRNATLHRSATGRAAFAGIAADCAFCPEDAPRSGREGRLRTPSA
jgi:hypothetical protein